jgi:hypothetical protein
VRLRLRVGVRLRLSVRAPPHRAGSPSSSRRRALGSSHWQKPEAKHVPLPHWLLTAHGVPVGPLQMLDVHV